MKRILLSFMLMLLTMTAGAQEPDSIVIVRGDNTLTLDVSKSRAFITVEKIAADTMRYNVITADTLLKVVVLDDKGERFESQDVSSRLSLYGANQESAGISCMSIAQGKETKDQQYSHSLTAPGRTNWIRLASSFHPDGVDVSVGKTEKDLLIHIQKVMPWSDEGLSKLSITYSIDTTAFKSGFEKNEQGCLTDTIVMKEGQKLQEIILSGLSSLKNVQLGKTFSLDGKNVAGECKEDLHITMPDMLAKGEHLLSIPCTVLTEKGRENVSLLVPILVEPGGLPLWIWVIVVVAVIAVVIIIVFSVGSSLGGFRNKKRKSEDNDAQTADSQPDDEKAKAAEEVDRAAAKEAEEVEKKQRLEQMAVSLFVEHWNKNFSSDPVPETQQTLAPLMGVIEQGFIGKNQKDKLKKQYEAQGVSADVDELCIKIEQKAYQEGKGEKEGEIERLRKSLQELEEANKKLDESLKLEMEKSKDTETNTVYVDPDPVLQQNVVRLEEDLGKAREQCRILEENIEVQDRQLKEKDRLLGEKGKEAEEKDKTLEEKDKIIREKDAEWQKKESELAELRTLLAEARKGAGSGRDKLVEQAEKRMEGISLFVEKLVRSVEEMPAQSAIFLNAIGQIKNDFTKAKDNFMLSAQQWKTGSGTIEEVKKAMSEQFVKSLRKQGWMNNIAMLESYSRLPALNTELEAHGIGSALLGQLSAAIAALLGAADMSLIVPSVLAADYAAEAYEYRNADTWIDKFFSSVSSRDYGGKVFDIVQVGYTIGSDHVTRPVVQYY